jgi:hypothetical protein
VTDEFYEDDEPVEDVFAAFASGWKGITANVAIQNTPGVCAGCAAKDAEIQRLRARVDYLAPLVETNVRLGMEADAEIERLRRQLEEANVTIRALVRQEKP